MNELHRVRDPERSQGCLKCGCLLAGGRADKATRRCKNVGGEDPERRSRRFRTKCQRDRRSATKGANFNENASARGRALVETSVYGERHPASRLLPHAQEESVNLVHSFKVGTAELPPSTMRRLGRYGDTGA